MIHQHQSRKIKMIVQNNHQKRRNQLKKRYVVVASPVRTDIKTNDKSEILVCVLGAADAVTYNSKRQNYTFWCPHTGCTFMGDHGESYMVRSHCDEFQAKRTMHVRKAQYLYITSTSRSGYKKPYPCIYCPMVCTNIVVHNACRRTSRAGGRR